MATNAPNKHELMVENMLHSVAYRGGWFTGPGHPRQGGHPKS